jgi:glycosyltransferase involved in cell wall biosynthesis
VLLARRGTRSRARVVTEIHGDWRTATRLYGSSLRAPLGRVADRVAEHAIRGSDRVRTVSVYTSNLVRDLGIEPVASFPAYIDTEPFLASPPVALPQESTVLFVGVLERYKNIDGLAEAWRVVAGSFPDACLHIVGKGSRDDVVRALLRDVPGSVRWTPELDQAGIIGALDSSTVLVLPSRSEGLGRVVIEAACRARAVVATRVGGIPELVEDDVTGLLVEPGSTADLALALERLLREPSLAHELGTGARQRVTPLLRTPEEYADQVRAMIDAVTAGDALPSADADEPQRLHDQQDGGERQVEPEHDQPDRAPA